MYPARFIWKAEQTMKKLQKAASCALAAALGCAVFAGCDLVSTNTNKDYEQVIAQVNIAQSEDFAEGGKYAAYKDAITQTEITKLDMVAYFVSTGYSVMQLQGWTYYDTFNMISETLVNRAIYLQYAVVYLLENGDADGNDYTMEGLSAEVAAAPENKKSLAAYEYFLDEDEEAKALYETRVMFNSTIDTQEEGIIAAEEEEDSEETVRTLPTGVNTEDEDYFDPLYRVYTGSNEAAQCGSYETVEGSTPSTRKRAYNAFLGNLRSNNLVRAGENVLNADDPATEDCLSYFMLELENAYEDALLQKLSEKFEAEAMRNQTDARVQNRFEKETKDQKNVYGSDEEAFEAALDEMSDDSFVLCAPEAGYGFVVNILIPFSATQTAALEKAPGDTGDKKGNKFKQRAALLKEVTGTDQRGTWITGADDHSFEADTIADKFTGATADDKRTLLFFEDGITEGTRYERIPNYLGRYTYNGTYNEEKNAAKPNRVTIDDFITEMEGYLQSSAVTNALGAQDDTISVSGQYVASIDESDNVTTGSKEDYFSASKSYYKDDGTVDYSKFIYYAGSVDFSKGFDANDLFLKGSAENVVYSAINELSFAYNTDTAGLNTYLGYSVVTGKTSYVSEFEYAAQYVCRKGAGNYVVVATDYGWHVIYCTFSFMEGNLTPFSYDGAKKEDEGSFSNLYYEALRAEKVEMYTQNMQTQAVNAYSKFATVYEDRYADLSGLDTAN